MHSQSPPRSCWQEHQKSCSFQNTCWRRQFARSRLFTVKASCWQKQRKLFVVSYTYWQIQFEYSRSLTVKASCWREKKKGKNYLLPRIPVDRFSLFIADLPFASKPSAERYTIFCSVSRVPVVRCSLHITSYLQFGLSVDKSTRNYLLHLTPLHGHLHSLRTADSVPCRRNQPTNQPTKPNQTSRFRQRLSVDIHENLVTVQHTW